MGGDERGGDMVSERMWSTRLLLGTLALLPAFGCRGRDAIVLTLQNVGTAALDSVVVFTTGRAYRVGSLGPGASKQVLIGASGESHIEIEHGQDSRRRLRVGTYFEKGYGGKVVVRLTGDSVVAVIDSIRI
jgi:hypothetical protein